MAGCAKFSKTGEGVMKMKIVEWNWKEEILKSGKWYHNVTIGVYNNVGNGFVGSLYEISKKKHQQELEKKPLTTISREMLDLKARSGFPISLDVFGGTAYYIIHPDTVYEVFDVLDGKFFFMLDEKSADGYRKMSKEEVIEYLNSKVVVKKALWISRHPLDSKAEEALKKSVLVDVDVIDQIDFVFSEEYAKAFMQLEDLIKDYQVFGGVFPAQLWFAMIHLSNWHSLRGKIMFLVVSKPVDDEHGIRKFEYANLELHAF